MSAPTKEELQTILFEANMDWPRPWQLVIEFVAEWLVSRPGLLPVQPEDLADAWREYAE